MAKYYVSKRKLEGKEIELGWVSIRNQDSLPIVGYLEDRLVISITTDEFDALARKAQIDFSSKSLTTVGRVSEVQNSHYLTKDYRLYLREREYRLMGLGRGSD